MILLDTNVVSEPMRPTPDGRVVAWIDAQALETLFLPVIAVAELRAGVALLPAGKRRAALDLALETQVLPLFADRILAFDLSCTAAYAALMLRARQAGASIGHADGCIAAIAAAHGLTVATRDVTPFLAAGVAVIDPWSV